MGEIADQPAAGQPSEPARAAPSEREEFTPDWLALREPEDARARSRALAQVLGELLAARSNVADRASALQIHDLGSGTGSMMRWLAPLLPGPQRWTLHDRSAALLADAGGRTAPLDRDGKNVEVATQLGELSELGTGGERDTPGSASLSSAALITASALIDVLTAGEVDAIVRACVDAGAPAYFALNVSGGFTLRPAHPADHAYAAAFNAHQRRCGGARSDEQGGQQYGKDGAQDRRPLGASGAAYVANLFTAAGWQVRQEETLWNLGAADPELLAAWFDGWATPAEEQCPSLSAIATAYREQRGAHMLRGEFTAIVTHTDVLAWP